MYCRDPFVVINWRIWVLVVIKVENPKGGDLARQLGADPELVKGLMGISFLAQNAGKRSITIDLKQPEGKDLFRRVASHCPRRRGRKSPPGVMKSLGLAYEDLLEYNPCSSPARFQGLADGPLRDRPAYDQIIQGMAGVMSITGAPDTAPYRVGYPVAELLAGSPPRLQLPRRWRTKTARAVSFSTFRCSHLQWCRWVGPCRTC